MTARNCFPCFIVIVDRIVSFLVPTKQRPIDIRLEKGHAAFISSSLVGNATSTCCCSILLFGAEEPHLAINSGATLNIFYNMSASTTDIFASSVTMPFYILVVVMGGVDLVVP